MNPMFDSYSQNEQPQEDQTHPQHFWNVTGESSTVYYENNKDNVSSGNKETGDIEHNSWENTEMQDDLRSQTNAEEKHDQYNTEKNDMQSTQTQTAPKEEEDNEPKPWDEYFNSL